MKLFDRQNRDLESRKLYALYEIAHTAVDFIAALSFLVGSVLFLWPAYQNPCDLALHHRLCLLHGEAHPAARTRGASISDRQGRPVGPADLGLGRSCHSGYPRRLTHLAPVSGPSSSLSAHPGVSLLLSPQSPIHEGKAIRN